MSILRGIQSAIFFYVSCAPCYGYAHQRRRRREGNRDRREKRALELEQPDLYRHPDPSSTNPYWNEEIALGPGPPPRKGGKKAKRNLATSSTFDSTSTRRVDSSLEDQGVVGIQFGSPGASETTLNDDSWNRRRYQREDEELWGTDTLDTKRAVSSAGGSSIGLVGLSRPDTGNSGSDNYYIARAPPVNELHPPVVSMPHADKRANQWMLQPPPNAKIMAGKQKTSIRSRSGSQASSRVDINLQKEISQRKIEEKLKRGHTPELPPLSRGSSFLGHSPKQGRLDRTSVAEDSDASDEGVIHDSRHDSGNPLNSISGNSPKVARPRPAKLTTVQSEQSIPTAPQPLKQRSLTLHSYKPTAVHKENVSLQHIPRAVSKERSGPLTIRDSSLNLLQELVSPSALLDSHFVKSPTVEAKIQLPPMNSSEELALRSLSPWFPSDDFMAAVGDADSLFDRDPRMRWSMDI